MSFGIISVVKLISWNVQACRIRTPQSDPAEGSSYTKTDVEYVASTLSRLTPDVVFLQEIHANDSTDQAQDIAERIGFEHVFTDVIDEESFMDGNYRFCQAIISKYPLSNHSYTPLEYPPFEVTNEKGHFVSRDSSMSKVLVDVNGCKAELITTHFMPFGVFGVDPISPAADNVRNALNRYLASLGNNWVLAGDLNVNMAHPSEFVPVLFENGDISAQSINEPTAAWGMTLDHVICKGLMLQNLHIESTTLTDHFPIVAELECN